MAQPGRIAGAMGMASMNAKEYVKKVYTVPELQEKWLRFLEDRGPRTSTGWKRALKDLFHGGPSVDFQGFVRATCGLYTEAEGQQLWTLWSCNGRCERSDIEKALESLMTGETPIFANANKGASLDALCVLSKTNPNAESADFPSNDPDGPFAFKGTLASASERPITASKPFKPPDVERKAGLSMASGAKGTASSVPGGIFSEEFTMADLQFAQAEKHTNWPSQPGGIFLDCSQERPVPKNATSRSQKSSVAGGIFAGAERPDTVEYGYEPFPRKGLNTTGRHDDGM